MALRSVLVRQRPWSAFLYLLIQVEIDADLENYSPEERIITGQCIWRKQKRNPLSSR